MSVYSARYYALSQEKYTAWRNFAQRHIWDNPKANSIFGYDCWGGSPYNLFQTNFAFVQANFPASDPEIMYPITSALNTSYEPTTARDILGMYGSGDYLTDVKSFSSSGLNRKYKIRRRYNVGIPRQRQNL